MKRTLCTGLMLMLLLVLLAGCGEKEVITDLSQLESKIFAVPTGTVADELVLSKFPNAEFQYYNTVLDCALAVKSEKADAAAYDEPILKNIAAKNSGLKVLPDMITYDNYGFAVELTNEELKKVIDEVVSELKADGTYDDMMSRWLPETGDPAPMPEIELTGTKGTLKYGTAAITEPFSFIDGSQKEVGFDIELAMYIAQRLEMDLEIMNLDFGGLIPALTSGKVDMIGACITITEERAKSVLFSEPYYVGGIAALVRE
ncbi:transporter substrate-binding domain-containing protein [Candidatus Contubernalis alkaliaceticus]|uniref:transporter substrate-binding domain-containing protein n=1 Tax=Candidatus Contubernalis alkaliaceticus TaxID=338645 RepID=UPI001F4C01CC|nr:transporter substrate-binding domain-containing protein [Candidatus Contubernalis alkalaceticus]UNC92455.1 transporter substrate-binding domain-containing protein [Candidatus Contubernalis alkalaceticus]